MRLFIGLGVSEAARESLWNAVSSMGIQGRFTLKENYHITLAFLGPRDARQTRALVPIIAAAAKESPPMMLAVNGFGYFGRRENALFHATLAPSPSLHVLSDALRDRLTDAGETFDTKPFAAHITLVRKARLEPTRAYALQRQIPFSADQLTLYESTRIQGVLRYIPVNQKPFLGKQTP